MRRFIVLALLASACTGDVDEPWFLDHDRIVAVRATPPRIDQGFALIDTLVAHKGAPLAELPPQLATVVSPTSLAGALAMDGSAHWIVTMPSEAQLAAARTELALAADAPVPLLVGVRVDELNAVKRVVLGQAADNPPVDDVTIAGAPAPISGAITVPELTDVPLVVSTEDTDEVNWLTSCGTMHDFDLAKAYVRVEKDDPHAGQLAVVVRTALGGVSWRMWDISAP
jgi:hypothetical protein